MQLKDEFEQMSKKCSERVAEMCLLEKETWQRLDKLEEDCERLNKKVQAKADKLVKFPLTVVLLLFDTVSSRIKVFIPI